MSSDSNSEEFYGRGSNAAAGRGIALVVIAIAAGLGVLKWGLDDKSTAGTPPAVTTTTTTTKPAGVTASTAPVDTGVTVPSAPTAGQPRNPSAVKVQVANGSGTTGLGAKYTEKLTPAGYVTSAARNADATKATVIYYAATYQAEATAAAAVLGIPATTLAPLPAAGVTGKGESLLVDNPNILVILGADLVPATGG